jgi:HemY protein
MAEIEEGEHGDQGRVRSWLARALIAPRDPVWTADDQVFDRWAPVSPVSGRVGAFEWKVVAEPRPPREAVELEAEIAASPPRIRPPESPPAEAREPHEASQVTDIEPELPPVPLDTTEAPPTAVAHEPLGARVLGPGPPPEPAPVLLHAPDDPGPAEGATRPRRRFRLF